MSSHLSPLEVEKYHTSDVLAEERLRLCDHIAECAVCRAQVRDASPRRFDAVGFQSALLRTLADDASALQVSDRPRLRWEPLWRPRILVPTFGAAALIVLAFFAGRYPLQQKTAMLNTALQGEQAKNVALTRKINDLTLPQQQGAGAYPKGTDVNTAALTKLQEELKAAQTSLAQAGSNQQRQTQQANEQRQQDLAHIAILEQKNARLTKANADPKEGIFPPQQIKMAMATPDPKELTTGTFISRGDSENGLKQVALVAPVATRVLERRPLFRWKLMEGAARYQLTLSALDKKGHPIGEPQQKDLPGGVKEYHQERDLTPGSAYIWEVSAFGKDETKEYARSAAKFAVGVEANPAASMRLSQDLLQGGALYEQAGLLDDAERLYNAVSPGHPQYAKAQKRLHELDARRQPKP